MGKNNHTKYYNGDENSKVSDETVELFLRSRELNDIESAILIKSLINEYISNGGYHTFFELDEQEKCRLFIENTENIEIIKYYKINTEQRRKDLFYKTRAYEILAQNKTKMMGLIYIVTATLLYYFSKSEISVLIYLISTMLLEMIINKNITSKIFLKAKKDIDNVSL